MKHARVVLVAVTLVAMAAAAPTGVPATAPAAVPAPPVPGTSAPAPASVPAGTPAGVPAPEPTQFVTTVVDDTFRVAEPGIDVAPDGTLYINGPSGLVSGSFRGGSHVFRSDDGGRTWVRTPPGRRELLPGGGDSDIAIGPDGTVAMTDLWLGSATVAVSRDKGQTWAVNPLQGVVVQDRPWLAAAGPGVVYHVTHQVPLGLVVSKSVDGGLTYLQSSVAASRLEQESCGCPPGTIVAEPAGAGRTQDRVGVIYAHNQGVKFARSLDGGATFGSVVIAGPPHGEPRVFPAVADGGNGRLAAVWLASLRIGGAAVMFSRSSDFGASWSTPVPIVQGGTPVYPWVDARGDKVAVSLYHTDAAGPGSGQNARWFVRYLSSSDGGRTFTEPVTVDPVPVWSGPLGRELGDFQSVALDREGHALITYVRGDPLAQRLPAGERPRTLLMFAKGR